MAELKVLTLNMNTGHGPSQGFRDKLGIGPLIENLRKIAEVIIQEKPDVVCLQEVDYRWRGTHNLNQAEVLRAMTNFPFVLQHSHHRGVVPELLRDITEPNIVFNRDTGTAILSRFPLGRMTAYDFGQSFSRNRIINYWARLLNESKGYIFTEIEIEGRKVGIMDVHLLNDIVYEIGNFLGGRKVRGEVFTRVWQVEKLLEHIGERIRKCMIPIVVTGDFNTIPREDRIKHYVDSQNGDPDDYRRDVSMYLIREAKSTDGMPLIMTIPELFGSGTPETIKPYHTYPALEPDRTLDYVFATPDVVFVDYRVVPIAVSDHLAVVATLRI